MPSMVESGTRILMGVVGRPFGVRGLVHVTSYTADPADLAAYGPLHDPAGHAWTLAWKQDGVAELRGPNGPVRDRTTAETLVNTRLYLDRDRLPAPQDDEFYLADLIGLSAAREDGAELGRVAHVHDYGAGASIEIDAHPAIIVPFTRACVPVVDIAAGRLIVVPPAEVVA